MAEAVQCGAIRDEQDARAQTVKQKWFWRENASETVGDCGRTRIKILRRSSMNSFSALTAKQNCVI